MAPRRRIRRQASSPDANVGKPKARRSWAVGRGCTRRRAAVMMPSVPSLPTKSWVRFGPVAARGPAALGAHHAPVGQHDLHPYHHVLDLPVARRVLPRATTSQPAPDGREVHGLGPVTERVAPVRSRRPQGRLQVGPERAGADVCQERGLVERDESVQSGQVERDAAVHRDGAAAHAAASRGRRHRHDRLVARRQDGRDLGHRDRADDRARALRHRALDGPSDGQRPPVTSGLGPGRRVRGHRGAARGDPVEHGVWHLDDVRTQVVPHLTGLGVDGRDRRGRRHAGSSPAVRSSF